MGRGRRDGRRHGFRRGRGPDLLELTIYLVVAGQTAPNRISDEHKLWELTELGRAQAELAAQTLWMETVDKPFVVLDRPENWRGHRQAAGLIAAVLQHHSLAPCSVTVPPLLDSDLVKLVELARARSVSTLVAVANVVDLGTGLAGDAGYRRRDDDLTPGVLYELTITGTYRAGSGRRGASITVTSRSYKAIAVDQA